MDYSKADSCKYCVRVKDLEEKIYNLRIGRRVLLSLVERIQHEKTELQKHLEDENYKLKQENIRIINKLLGNEQRVKRTSS